MRPHGSIFGSAGNMCTQHEHGVLFVTIKITQILT